MIVMKNATEIRSYFFWNFGISFRSVSHRAFVSSRELSDDYIEASTSSTLNFMHSLA